VLLVSLGFLLASVIGDLMHSIAAGYPVYLLAVKKKRSARHSAVDIRPLSEADAD
jgi:hypothetical protein